VHCGGGGEGGGGWGLTWGEVTFVSWGAIIFVSCSTKHPGGRRACDRVGTENCCCEAQRGCSMLTESEGKGPRACVKVKKGGRDDVHAVMASVGMKRDAAGG
jgi:hypothetical protein